MGMEKAGKRERGGGETRNEGEDDLSVICTYMETTMNPINVYN